MIFMPVRKHMQNPSIVVFQFSQILCQLSIKPPISSLFKEQGVPQASQSLLSTKLKGTKGGH